MSSLIKVSEYVARFLVTQGVRHVFAISGGASLHMIHGIADQDGIDYITPHHEQAAAMAADGYARVTSGLGVAIATSGPGATNLLTGIAGCYYDSVATLFLCGQTSTFRMVGDTGVRQIGFQETPIVDMCKKITKYAVQITAAQQIRYELEKAVAIAHAGRPGPVLIDIPDDIQRSLIDPDVLEGYQPTPSPAVQMATTVAADFLQSLSQAQRPVMILGWGVRLSKSETEAIAFAEKLNIPIALTWGAADIVPPDHPLYIGTFGTHGMRHANFAVQNADLILSIGSRLDTKSTGTPVKSFAREAKKFVVDIDANELNKFAAFGLTIDHKICCDAQIFLTQFSDDVLRRHACRSESWLGQIAAWKKTFAAFDVLSSKLELDPYFFIDCLSAALPTRANVFADTGCTIAWAMQRLKLDGTQRVFHDFNNTAMGWALPAAIGGFFAQPERPLIGLVGDGSLMMSLHELATLQHHKIPLKLFVINNSGYAMIRQTQDQWLGSRYHASSPKGGLSFPDYRLLAASFDMRYQEMGKNADCKAILQDVFAAKGSCLCNIIIPAEACVVPQVKFGRPNEDMEPLLPRATFFEQMIVKTLDASKA